MPEESDIVLSVKDVTKDFYLPHEKQNSIKSAVVNLFKPRNKEADTQHALRGISFDIKEGEFFGILGRNGSGKSTTLKMISEIYQPTTGTVTHKGKLVPFIELGVGFNPELTGRENVYLNGALLGFSEKEIDARYDEIVAFAELENFMDQKLKNYSSGMQVRLAFAVATHAEADILVVDEVLAVGDADFQRKCYDFFKSLKKSGKTVVFVTHDMNAVREYCDRAVLIQDGVIVCSDKAGVVANEYLQLFNEPDTEDEAAVEVVSGNNRYGNGRVRFKSIDTSVTNDTVAIDITITNGKLASDVIVGLRLCDSEGKLIAGGNTEMFLNGEHLEFQPAESKRIKYRVPKNIFGAGTKMVGASIKLRDRITICDDWTDAATFSIAAEESYYPIVLPVDITVEDL